MRPERKLFPFRFGSLCAVLEEAQRILPVKSWICQTVVMPGGSFFPGRKSAEGMLSVACTRAFGRGRRGYFRLGFKGQRVGAFRMSHGIMPLFPHKIPGAFSCWHMMEAETSRIGQGFKLCENFCIILLKMGRSRRKFFNLRYCQRML